MPQWNPEIKEWDPFVFVDSQFNADRSISVNRAKYSTEAQLLSNVLRKGKLIDASNWGIAKIRAKSARKITHIAPQSNPIAADTAKNIPGNPAHALILVDNSISNEEAVSVVVRLAKKFNIDKPPS